MRGGKKQSNSCLVEEMCKTEKRHGSKKVGLETYACINEERHVAERGRW